MSQSASAAPAAQATDGGAAASTPILADLLPGTSPPSGAPDGGEAPAEGAPAGQPSGAPQPIAKADPPDWALNRIDELTRKTREAEAREAALIQQLADAQAGKPSNLPPEQVRAMAEQMAQAKVFNDQCVVVANKGKETFPDWDSSIGNFQRIGGTTPQFLEGLLEQGDDAAKVLHSLSKDLGEAARIMQIQSPARQAAALTKYALKLGNQTQVAATAQAATEGAPQVGSAAGSPLAGRTSLEPIPGVIGTGRANSGPVRLDDPRLPIEKFMEERNKAEMERRTKRRA